MSLNSYQSTLDRILYFSGQGVHSGQRVDLAIKPAPIDHGIVFVREEAKSFVRLPAHASFIGASELCTTLKQDDKQIETIEHLMAAICAMGLDNLEIKVNRSELPILDGSAAPFMRAFMAADIVMQEATRSYIKILKPISVAVGDAIASFLPLDAASHHTTSFDITIDFASQAIGRQHIAFDLTSDFFAHEIAPARTFGFLKDAERLRALGLARGASLDNTLIIGTDDKVMNAQGTLFDDEFVRHKALDAIGDTSLLGKPFIGLYRSLRGGHQLNARVVKALLEAPEHFEIVEIKNETVHPL